MFPTQATSIVVANGKTLAAYDGSTARPGAAPFGYAYFQSASIYARQSNGTFYAYTNGAISTLAVSASGVSITSSVAALPILEARATWSGGLVTDDWGYVFNLDSVFSVGRRIATGFCQIQQRRNRFAGRTRRGPRQHM